MGRRYTVMTYSADRKAATTYETEEPDVALDLFRRALASAGHTEAQIEDAMQTFTLALMGGAKGCNFLDPDLTGSVEILINTSTPRQVEG